jgi:hypothetical protein
MSLSLAGKPTSAAISPGLSVNLLTRARASVENVARTTSSVKLAVAVQFLGQQASIVLPFTVTEHDIGFDIVLS